jgi:hypothetical protein
MYSFFMKIWVFEWDRQDSEGNSQNQNMQMCISLNRETLHYIRISVLAYLKCWPYENEGFAFISDRYTITNHKTSEIV